MARKLNKRTGLSFLEKILAIAGDVVLAILANKSKTRGAEKPTELTPEQIKKLNELL